MTFSDYKFECKDLKEDGTCRLIYRGQPCKKEECERFKKCHVCTWKIKNLCRREIDFLKTCEQNM